MRNAEISGITQKSRALILRDTVLVVRYTNYMIIKLSIKSINNCFESCLLIVRKKILNIFQKNNFGTRHFNDFCNIEKNGSFCFILKTMLQANTAKCLVIPKFRITRLIPNKIRIPKPSRESLQRKDFCIKTSG